MTSDLADSLSDDQRRARDAITAWYRSGTSQPLTLGGLAGTGKTTLVALLPEFLPDAEIAFCAPTGKATAVLRRKLPDGVPPDRVTTLHRLLYKAHEVTACEFSGELLKGKADRCPQHAAFPQPCPVRVQVSFTPAPAPLDGIDLVVADEASMIPGQLWADLTSHGVPVLAVGDHGQLPPVQSSFNLMAAPDLRLEVIHRQAAADPAGAAILSVARWARERGEIPHGWHGPGVVKVRPQDMGRVGLHPADAQMIICATNAARSWHNQAMRSWFGRSGAPQPGDAVICLRNDWSQGLYNGQRGVITAAGAAFDASGEAVFPATVELEDLAAPWSGTVASAPFGAARFQPGSVRDREIALFDYGYALTCHKCVDDQTLILTRQGWKNHAELTEGTEVLTLNPDTQLSEWQPVQAVHRYDVRDEPVLSIEAESHSSLTTPNHRWPVRNRHSGRTIWRTSRDLHAYPSSYRAIFKAAHHQGFPVVPKYSDALTELVAWFWTEGHVNTNRGKPISSVRVSQSLTANPGHVAAIRNALIAEYGPARKLGRHTSLEPGWSESTRTVTQAARTGAYTYPERTFDYVTFTLNNAAGAVIQACAPGKVVSPEFVLSLTRAQLELFIRASINGDGSVHGGKYASIRQSSRERLEAFQLACTLAGYSTVIRYGSSGTWHFRLKTGQLLHPRAGWWRDSMRIVPYSGTVWCPQTANGTWFAKRNETTYFTGNSQGSQAEKVLVIEEGWPPPGTADRSRWLYTAASRAQESLTVVGW